MSEFSVFGTHFTHQRDHRTHTLLLSSVCVCVCVIDIITVLRGFVIFSLVLAKFRKGAVAALFSRRTTAELPPSDRSVYSQLQDFRQQGNDF